MAVVGHFCILYRDVDKTLRAEFWGHGRQFKEWARHSMAVSHFWYSAYRDLTTEQIERNYRIALGLRKRVLMETEAAQWLNDL